MEEDFRDVVLKRASEKGGLVLTIRVGEALVVNKDLAIKIISRKGNYIRVRFIDVGDKYNAIHRIKKAIPL